MFLQLNRVYQNICRSLNCRCFSSYVSKNRENIDRESCYCETQYSINEVRG